MLTRLYLYIGGLVAAVALFASVWFAGNRNAKTKADAKAMRRELEAHDRINEIDTGIGASDVERIKRLQQLGREWDRH